MFDLHRQSAIVRKMIEETGINPHAIYCQITGARIARMRRSEIDLMWSTINESMDDDEIIDELYTRTITSMRPSPAWNYIRRETLESIRKSNPVALAAYLLGRYFEPRDKAYSRLQRTLDQRITDGVNRIKSFAAINAMASQAKPEDINEFVTLLLLIDSEFNLADMSQFANFPKTPIDFDVARINDYILALQAAYLAQCEKRDAQIRRQKLDQSYYNSIGNGLAKYPAARAFLDLKPESLAAQQRKEKESKLNALTNLIASFMRGDDGVGNVVEPPAPNPAIKSIQPLRLKPINLKKAN